jgi:hypothetical protein
MRDSASLYTSSKLVSRVDTGYGRDRLQDSRILSLLLHEWHHPKPPSGFHRATDVVFLLYGVWL